MLRYQVEMQAVQQYKEVDAVLEVQRSLLRSLAQYIQVEVKVSQCCAVSNAIGSTHLAQGHGVGPESQQTGAPTRIRFLRLRMLSTKQEPTTIDTNTQVGDRKHSGEA